MNVFIYLCLDIYHLPIYLFTYSYVLALCTLHEISLAFNVHLVDAYSLFLEIVQPLFLCLAANPDITVKKITQDHEFIFLACDGMFSF